MPAPANQSAPAKKVRFDIIAENSVFPGFLHLQKSNNPAVGLFVSNQGATDKKPAAGNAAKPTSRKKVCSALTKNIFPLFFVNDVIICKSVIIFFLPPIPQDEEEGADASNALDDGTQGKGPFKPPDQQDLTEAVRGRGSLSGLARKLAQNCAAACSPWPFYLS